MKPRDLCLDVIAYFGIATILMLGAPTEWKNGQRVLSVVSVIVGLFMIWEGIENYLHHCDGIKPHKWRIAESGSNNMESAKLDLESKVMSMPNVWGIGTVNMSGAYFIQVDVSTTQAAQSLSSLIVNNSYNGFPVVVSVSPQPQAQ